MEDDHRVAATRASGAHVCKALHMAARCSRTNARKSLRLAARQAPRARGTSGAMGSRIMRILASLTGAAALAVLFFVTSAARADDDGAPPTETPATAATARVTQSETRWYGWQTLAVDAGSLGAGLALGSIQGQGGNGAVAALTGYALGGPIVHAAHGRTDAALGDLALRVGAMAGGAAIGYGVGVASFQGCAPGTWFCSRDFAGIGGAIVGGLGGAVTAVILDAAVLGRERVRKDDAAGGVRWTPQVGVSPRGEPSVGVGGSF
jgi:hypothetical protein